jgi:hypothetical protein
MTDRQNVTHGGVEPGSGYHLRETATQCANATAAPKCRTALTRAFNEPPA